MEKKKHVRFPIRLKTFLMIAGFGIILAEIAMVFFTVVSSNTNRKDYMNLATDLSNTVALSVNYEQAKSVTEQVLHYYTLSPTKPGRDQQGTPEYEAYMAQFETVRQSEDYKALQKYLQAVKAANADTDGIYLAYVDVSTKRSVYLVYDVENEDFPVGIIDPIYEEDYPMLDDPMLGFVASIYVDEVTGQTLVTAGAPVVGPDGKVLCYCLVDITMATVRAKQASDIVRLFIYLISTVALLCAAGMVIIHFIVVKPVKTLQKAAMSYDVDHPYETHEAFEKLQLNVHDEFADLAESMKEMESDIHAKIHDLTEANESLIASRKFADHMAELANKDALTGMRNKIAYDEQVRILNEKIKNKEGVRFGIAMVDLNYLKNINDELGHKCGDHALLKLSSLLCSVFYHSPVYRVGGDEFVVLVRNVEYDEATFLVEDFKHHIEEISKDETLPKEERISAAIGYAAFDPEADQCVEDVFQRADKAMYANKKEMKER